MFDLVFLCHFFTKMRSFCAHQTGHHKGSLRLLISPGPGLWSLVLGPFGPDLYLSWDLDLDLSLTDGQTDTKTHRQTDGQTDGQTNNHSYRQTDQLFLYPSN